MGQRGASDGSFLQVHTLFKDRTSPQQFKGQSCVSSDASTPADIVGGFYCPLFISHVAGGSPWTSQPWSPRGILELQLC